MGFADIRGGDGMARLISAATAYDDNDDNDNDFWPHAHNDNAILDVLVSENEEVTAKEFGPRSKFPITGSWDNNLGREDNADAYANARGRVDDEGYR